MSSIFIKSALAFSSEVGLIVLFWPYPYLIVAALVLIHAQITPKFLAKLKYLFKCSSFSLYLNKSSKSQNSGLGACG